MKISIIIIVLSAALLFLCVVMLGIFWTSIRQIDFSGEIVRPVLAEAEAAEEKILKVNGPATLDVRISEGSIAVNAAEVDTVTISMHKTAFAEYQAKAEEELKKMQVDITQTGNNIQVVFEQPPGLQMDLGGYRRDRVDLTIQVPIETGVTAFSNSGDVSLSGTRSMARIASDFGDLHASKITGSLSASTGSGTVEASEIQAGQSDIDLKSDYGNIRLENAKADTIRVHSSSGMIDLADIEASGDLEATSDFGNLSLAKAAAGSLDLGTSSGTITVEGVSGTVKAHSDYGKIQVTGGEDATLNLSASSGSVDYSGALGEGPHSLKSDHGGITINIPADTALTIDLKTDFGDIDSAFPVTSSGNLDEHHWIGSINGGGKNLAASTNSGNIRIEVLNP